MRSLQNKKAGLSGLQGTVVLPDQRHLVWDIYPRPQEGSYLTVGRRMGLDSSSPAVPAGLGFCILRKAACSSTPGCAGYALGSPGDLLNARTVKLVVELEPSSASF